MCARRRLPHRREKPVNEFRFGNQRVTTKVFMMAPAGSDEISVDVMITCGKEQSDDATVEGRVLHFQG